MPVTLAAAQKIIAKTLGNGKDAKFETLGVVVLKSRVKAEENLTPFPRDE